MFRPSPFTRSRGHSRSVGYEPEFDALPTGHFRTATAPTISDPYCAKAHKRSLTKLSVRPPALFHPKALKPSRTAPPKRFTVTLRSSRSVSPPKKRVILRHHRLKTAFEGEFAGEQNYCTYWGNIVLTGHGSGGLCTCCGTNWNAVRAWCCR